jgi:transcriptional regulator with XRE-family HTH domain
MDITALRKELNLTQTEFAQALGISPGHVGDLERGRRKVSLPIAARLEALTGKDLVAELVAQKTGRAA